MTQAARLIGAAVFAVGLAVTIGCQSGSVSPSPTATVTLGSPLLSPTLKVTGGENLCCCHIVGTVRNTSTQHVHVELQFPANDKVTLVNVGTALDLLKDISPGESRAFEAVGIQSACSSLDPAQITKDQRVRIILFTYKPEP